MKFYFYIFILILFTSCYKNETVFIPDQSYAINSEIFLSKFISEPASYILNLEKETTFLYTKDNIVLEIPSQSLKDSLGNIVTNEVKIEFKEYTSTKTDLLRSPSTIFENHIISPKKLIYLKFSHNGANLYINEKISIYFHKTNEEKRNLEVLTGVGNDAQIVWQKPSNPKINAHVNDWTISDNESQQQISGIKLEILGNGLWYSVLESESNSFDESNDFFVKTDPDINNKNSLAYFIADDSQSVIRMTWHENDGFILKLKSNLDEVSGKIIIISQFGDEIYKFGTTNAVSKNKNIQIKSDWIAYKDLKAALSAL